MYKSFVIKENTVNKINKIYDSLKENFDKIEEIKDYNNLKVLKAFQNAMIRENHFESKTGYSYGDAGREALEEVYAEVFGGEASLVRPSIASGTHAISIMLHALLRYGDTMLCITGRPYDTLHEVIGIDHKNGSTLIEAGIKYEEIKLNEDGSFNTKKIIKRLKSKDIKIVYIQRSRGYSNSKNFSFNELENIIKIIKDKYTNVIIAVDNCYGEFTRKKEPTDIGADIIAGSLIKNPGGSLAISGGYIVGNSNLIELCAHKLTAPGLGKEIGGTFGTTRTVLQGLFIAPEIVNTALKSAILFAKYFKDSGYKTLPDIDDERNDIIQCVSCNNEEDIIKICQMIQKSSPVDSYITPIPWNMPGYSHKVIMAAGTFIQGSSIELSADAPIREPFTVYIQGGIMITQSKLACMLIEDKLSKEE